MRDIATIVLYGPRYYNSEEVSTFNHNLYKKGFTRYVPDDAIWKREIAINGYKIRQVLGLKVNSVNGENRTLCEYWALLTAIDEQILPPSLEETALREFKKVLSKLGLRLVEEIQQ